MCFAIVDEGNLILPVTAARVVWCICGMCFVIVDEGNLILPVTAAHSMLL